MMHTLRQTILASFAIALGIGVGFLAAPAVHAQTQNELRAVIERMQRLEAEMNQMQRQVYRGGVPPSGAAPAAGGFAGGGELSTTQFGQLSSRLDEIEQQLRQMTGRLEDLDHRTAQNTQRMDKLVQDVDFRLAQIERQGAGAQQGQLNAPPSAGPSAAPTSAAAPSTPAALPQSSPQPGVLGTIPAGAVPPGNRGATTPTPTGGQQVAAAPATPAPRGKLPPGSPQDQYNYATSLLHKGDYEGAEVALNEFVTVNGKDPLASAAQYWLGESHFARRQYKESAQAFLSGYQKYPKGSKAPDSLLKLGISLENLKQKQEACAVFKQLLREYPNAEPRIKQTAQREQKDSGCPA